MKDYENSDEIIDLRDNIRRITDFIDNTLAGTKDYPAIIRTEKAYFLLENYPDNPDVYTINRLLPCPDKSSYVNRLTYVFDCNVGTAEEIYIEKVGRDDRDVVTKKSETHLSNKDLDFIIKMLDSKETFKLEPEDALDLLKESIKQLTQEYGSRDRGIQGLIGRIARKSS